MKVGSAPMAKTCRPRRLKKITALDGRGFGLSPEAGQRRYRWIYLTPHPWRGVMSRVDNSSILERTIGPDLRFACGNVKAKQLAVSS